MRYNVKLSITKQPQIPQYRDMTRYAENILTVIESLKKYALYNYNIFLL